MLTYSLVFYNLGYIHVLNSAKTALKIHGAFVNSRGIFEMIRIYLRVSSASQAKDGNGLDAQLEEINAFIDRQYPKEKTEEYREEGVSGTVPFDERKEGSRLISEIESGDILIVRDASRIGRTVYICSKLLHDMDNQGVTLITSKDSSAIKDASKRLTFFIFCAIAENERLEILARTSAGIKVKKANGGNIGGGIPFYLKKNKDKGGEYLPDPDGIITLKKIIDYFDNPQGTAAEFAKSIGKSAAFISKHKKLFNDGILMTEYERYKK